MMTSLMSLATRAFTSITFLPFSTPLRDMNNIKMQGPYTNWSKTTFLGIPARPRGPYRLLRKAYHLLVMGPCNWMQIKHETLSKDNFDYEQQQNLQLSTNYC